MEDHDKYIGLEISKTNNVLKRKCCIDDIYDDHSEITGKHGWIIGYLSENQDKEIFQRDIEEKFSIRRSTVSAIIKLMEKNGFIRREGVESDARLKKLVLTSKAKEIHSRMMAALDSMEINLRQDISPDELSVFFSVLEKIRNNAERQEEKQ